MGGKIVNDKFLGIFTHTEPVKAPVEQLESLKQVLEGNPYISGISIKISWKYLNPAEGVIDTDILEEMITLAAERGKHIHLVILPGLQNAPDWIYGKGVAKAGPVGRWNKLVKDTDTPVVWDDTYVRLLTEFFEAIAGKYAKDNRVADVVVQGHNYIGEEMHAPDPAIFANYVFSEDVVRKSWKYWIDLFNKLYPEKNLILVVSQMYKDYEHLCGEVADYFVKTVGNRAILQSDQLLGRHPQRGLSLDIISKYGDTVPNGHEMVGSFLEQPDRQGSPEQTICNFMKMGKHPMYLQLWRRDCDDPKYAKAVLDAWEKYKGMTSDEIKAQLQKENKFVEKSDWSEEVFRKEKLGS